MEPNSVRLIPLVFDKLFYHIAPADAIVCRNACQVFDPPAYRQVRYRLATPKNRMLLLAWPFCMHAGEDASNPYMQAEFYDKLRADDTRRIAAHPWISQFPNHKDIVDDRMREFLTGFESFMLHCVLSNIDLYTDLTVLMLDFHAQEFCIGDEYEGPVQTERSRWFLTKPVRRLDPWESNPWESGSKARALVMDAELWSNVINAVVAQCASTLRHFVFCSSLWLPEEFYTSLKLDRMLAQLQQLETLYMPSFEKCERAYSNSDSQGWCWQALLDLPPEKRLPSLRRVVADHTSLDRDNLFFFGNNGNYVGKRFVELLGNATLPPQAHNLSPRFVVELVFRPSFGSDFRHVLEPKLPHMLPNVTCYARDADSLMLSGTALYNLMNYDFDIFRDTIPEFITDVENLLLKAVQRRSQMLSVISDVRIGRDQKATVPALIGDCCMDDRAPENVALALTTLSRRPSWPPLSLTMELSWDGLLNHLSLFVVTSSTANKKENFADAHWTKCFARGRLKLRLTIYGGLLQYVTWDSRHSKMPYLNLRAENRYLFPSQVTIQFRPGDMEMKHGRGDNMISIRKYFTERMRKFGNDITGESPIFDNYLNRDTLAAIYATSRNLRADMYASCQILIIELIVQYTVFDKLDKSEAARISAEDVRRVERLLYDKQLEQELLRELEVQAFVNEEKQQLYVLPNLKSISFVRRVET